MKTFKNKEGATATEVVTPDGIQYEIKSPGFSGRIPASFIENSCDWTEVKEIIDNRDYIVLQYVTGCGQVYNKNCLNIYANDNKTSYYTEEELALKFDDLSVKSIERKSDGAQFTIGEHVSPCYSPTLHGPIIRFVASDNTIQIWGRFLGMEGMAYLAQVNPYMIKGYEVLEMVNPQGVVYAFNDGNCVSISNLKNVGIQAFIMRVASTNFKELEITKIKRTSDGQIIAVGDDFEYNGKNGPTDTFKSKLLKIEFEIAPADKGTGKLTFIHEDNSWGKWLRLSGFTIVPKFKTQDGVVINKGDEFWVVFKLMDSFIIKSKKYNGKRPKTFVCFSTRPLADKYVLDNTKGLSINDVSEICGIDNSCIYNKLAKKINPNFGENFDEFIDESFDDLPF